MYHLGFEGVPTDSIQNSDGLYKNKKNRNTTISMATLRQTTNKKTKMNHIHSLMKTLKSLQPKGPIGEECVDKDRIGLQKVETGTASWITRAVHLKVRRRACLTPSDDINLRSHIC